MSKQHLDHNYSKYTFDDFLQDDFFISSVRYPNKDTSLFWSEFQKKNPENLQEFYSAKSFLEQLVSQPEFVCDEDLSLVWDKIETTNKANIRRNKRAKHFYFITSGVAACILALIFLYPSFRKNIDVLPHDDIMSYAQSNHALCNSKDVQLVLSEDKTISIEDTESVIIYDSINIKASEQEVAKEESAVYNQLLVPKGKRSKLTLADGTKMHINSGTRVIYPVDFSKDKREIYVDGEIFIEVASESQRPFIVRTKDVNVQVLGTKFNVLAYESEPNKQVVLASGSVKILSSNNGDVILTPSQMYEYSNGREAIKKVNVGKYTSWTKGLYSYESERLDIILARLSRYYGMEITCDTDAANLKCSGKLDMKDDLNHVLNGLAYTLPIKVINNNEEYNIVIIN